LASEHVHLRSNEGGAPKEIFIARSTAEGMEMGNSGNPETAEYLLNRRQQRE
jgi:hypothetical protein